jgi:L-threonylcarbamoyladenylate synthase
MDAPNPPFVTRTLPYGTAAIGEAAALIAAGNVVAIPTETVYGLAADATDSHAVAAIYAAKGRPAFNPLIVHVPDLDAAQAIALFDDEATLLARRYWPGPLTLVLPRRTDAAIASLATAGLDTIALRVPAHRAMRALLAATGKPLAAPSANASGTISPTRAGHVAASLGGRIPLVIDDGPTECGLESTIVYQADGTTRILRHGPVTTAMLMATLGPGDITGDETPAPSEIRAPGQLLSHYAPAKPLRIGAASSHADEWMIGFADIAGDDTLSATGDLSEAAARLFDLLHRADASGKPRIAVAPIPADGLGAAINDRLRRAAHP